MIKLRSLLNFYIKVTDFAEEKEILSTGNELEDAIVAIRNKQNQKTAEKLAREKELAKVGDELSIESFLLPSFPLSHITESLLPYLSYSSESQP